MSPCAQESVAQLVEFFSTRLLLKRYRQGNRAEDAPDAVEDCEAEFTDLARRAVEQVASGDSLDALEWVEYCGDFSTRWMEVCHWVSPKRFREFLTTTIGAEWSGIENVPSDMELPPIHLKLYKNPDVSQPYVCPACNVRCNSLLQYNTHAQGKAHKTQARAWAKANDGKEPEPVPYEGKRKGKKVKKTRMLSVTSSIPDTASTATGPASPSNYLTVETSLLTNRSGSLGPCSPPLTPSGRRQASLCPSACSMSPQSTIGYDTSLSYASMPYQRDLSDGDENSEMHTSTSGMGTSMYDLLDSVQVLSAVHPMRAVDDATHMSVNKLDAVLAQLEESGSEDDEARVLELGRMLLDAAHDQVVYSLTDAAMRMADASRVAAVAATLAKEDARFNVLLVKVVAHLAEQGYGGLLEEVVPQGSAVMGLLTTFQHPSCDNLLDDDFQEHRARCRYRALMAFVTELVSHGVVGSKVLLTCIRIMLQNATYDDMAAAFTAGSHKSVLTRMSAAGTCELREIFAATLATRRVPNTLRALAMPVIQGTA